MAKFRYSNHGQVSQLQIEIRIRLQNHRIQISGPITQLTRIVQVFTCHITNAARRVLQEFH